MSKTNFYHWIPLLIIGIALALFFAFDLPRFFTIAMLKTYASELHQFVSDHPLLSPLLFIVFYSLTALFLLPIGVFLSLLAGFLFSHPLGELYVLTASTAGACLVYIATQSRLHDLYLKKGGDRIKNLGKRINQHDALFLLFLRVIPFSPYWLVNLACAFFGVRFWTFVWTTFIGNIPSTIIFVDAGKQLSKLLN